MDSLKQFELQKQIKENSAGFANTINDLHKWEKEIKRTSAANCQTKKNENYPIRSHKENVITNGYPKPTATTPTNAKPTNGATTLSDANSFKELGNKCVKSEDYETSIEHYTKAIEIKEDPVFYSNRAFSFLKLERYTECITDCSKAIELNPKIFKAFYRRMQANEVLGNFELALTDCEAVLNLDPKNKEAIQAKQRLSNRIAGKDLSTQSSPNIKVASWSKLDASVKDVNFIKKPPHLRSKKPLRRLQINQPLPVTNCTPPDKKSKDEENEAFKSAEVNIDQSNQLSNGLTDKVAEMIPLKAPNSSAQFYRTWRELNENSQKYSYLKIIDVTVLNKLLGSLFDSTMLSDLLKILSEFFISDNVPVTGILKQIIINNEFKILKLMMDTEDKNAFGKLLKYVESYESNAEDLAFIKDKYFNSM